MAIISCATPNTTKTALPFPKLMECTTSRVMGKPGTIVLFEKSGVGVVVAESQCARFNFGHHRDDWPMENFVDYDGEVTIEVN